MSDLLEGLNEAQRQAVTHEKGPLLIVAGAGTGKTTVLARRYAWLIQEKGLKTENILNLTFTEKAAQEMEDRVLSLLPNGTYDFWISTFHHFCQRILEERALEVGLPNRFRLLNETDSWLLLKRHIDELPLDHYRPLGNPVKFLSALLQHISRAKDEGVTAERYLRFAEECVLDGDSEIISGERKRLKELADCYFVYRRLLREQGCLDFGDLIVETRRLFQERPATLQEFRRQFKVIMIDEFQDTNWAQYELVKLLAGEDKNITVVGDDDQAIYKFRGASLANILQFRDDFPEAQTIALTENYRSHQEILDTAYGFIRKNDPARLEIKLAATGLTKKLRASRGQGGGVEAYWYTTLEEETEAVVQKIKTLKEERSDINWNDFAILVRSNDGAIPFVHALDRHGIPFRFYALRGLYGKPFIIDLVALLSVCDGSHESSSMWRVLTMKCYGFSVSEIAEFLQYAQRKSMSLWSAVKQANLLSEMNQECLVRAATLVSHIEALSETARRESPLKVLQKALDISGYLAFLLRLPEGQKLEALALLNAFADRIKRYEAASHSPTLREFLEELKQEIESGEEGALAVDPNAGPEMVKIMTVHAAKGLEFKHVFVVSLVDQRFPTRERHDAIPLPNGLVSERLPEGDAHLEEERRLFYVALTRAKDTLTLTGAAGYGGTRKKKPSVFVGEAGLCWQESQAASEQTAALVLPERHVTTEEIVAFPLKRRFSFTQLAAFRACPMQYKFAHVYRIPIPGSAQKSFGQSMHLTLHDVLKLHLDRGAAKQKSLFDVDIATLPVQGFRVTLDEAMEIFEERWIDEWFMSKKQQDEYRQEGRDIMKRMWKVWHDAPPQAAFLELPFEWRIGEHSLKGSVDRIDALPDGGYAIYDYKTGEPKTVDDLESGDKEQLRIYQLAMEERGLSIKKLAYIYLRNGQETPVDLLQGEKREVFKGEIQERMKEVLQSRFLPQPSPFICRYCDFKHVCEYRKL